MQTTACPNFVRPFLAVLALLIVGSHAAFAQSNSERWIEKPEQPVDELIAATTADPGDVNAHMTLGSFYLHSGDDKRAVKAFRRAIELNSDFSAAHLYLAMALNRQAVRWPLRTGDAPPPAPQTSPADHAVYEESDRAFESALRLDADDRFAWAIWADSLFRRSRNNVLLLPTADPSSIIDKYRRSLEIDPNYAMSSRGLAYVLLHYSAFILYLHKEPRTTDKASFPWLEEDLATQGRRYLEESAAMYAALVEKTPEDKHVYEPLIQALAGMERFDQAIDVAKAVIDRFPGSITEKNAYVWWGRILEHLGDHRSAEEFFNRAGSRGIRVDSE